MESGDNYKIVLVVAMDTEATAIADRLGLSAPSREILPYHFRQYDGPGTMLFTTGSEPTYGVEQVGTQPAAMLADYAIRTYRPSILLNAGTAGAFVRPGIEIGDVYLGYPEIVFHDRRIPIERFDAYGVGHFATPNLTQLAHLCGCKLGVISTGNSLDHTETDIQVMKKNGAIIKDMEAASHALVAEMYKVPFIAIKSVTDLIGVATAPANQFVANLQRASKSLSEKVCAVVDTLVNRADLRPAAIPTAAIRSGKDTLTF